MSPHGATAGTHQRIDPAAPTAAVRTYPWTFRAEAAGPLTDCESLDGRTPPFWTAMVRGANQPVAARGYVRFPDGRARTITAGTG